MHSFDYKYLCPVFPRFICHVRIQIFTLLQFRVAVNIFATCVRFMLFSSYRGLCHHRYRKRWELPKKSDILQSLPHTQLLSSKTQITNVYYKCDFNHASQGGVHAIFVWCQDNGISYLTVYTSHICFLSLHCLYLIEGRVKGNVERKSDKSSMAWKKIFLQNFHLRRLMLVS